jgi:hypothetical protein
MRLAPVFKAAVAFTLLESELPVDFAIALIGDFDGFDNTAWCILSVKYDPTFAGEGGVRLILRAACSRF